MTLLPIQYQIPPEVLDRVLALIDPEENQQDLEAVVKEQAKALEEGLIASVKLGVLPIWGREKDARTRFQSYLDATILEDLPYVLDPGFARKRRREGAPEYQVELHVEALLRDRTELMAGGVMPEQIPPALGGLQVFWALVLQLPAGVFEEFSRDFGRLWRRYEEPEPVAVEEPLLEPVGVAA